MTGTEKWIRNFPPRIRAALAAFEPKNSICEIRLRSDAPLSLTLFSGNVTITEKGRPCSLSRGMGATGAEMNETLSAFCEGSVYRYAEDLKDGFLITSDGIRIGVTFDTDGIWQPNGGRISSLNLRIPRAIPGASREILNFFRSGGLSSLLLLSLPGAGKTTLVRDLALSLAGGKMGEPRRIAVIDERRELFPKGLEGQCALCDLLSGKPKAQAIEVATRVLAPEIVLCDEIGSRDDTAAILSAQAGGCVFIATAHASSRETALQKPHLKALLESGVFQSLAVLERDPGENYTSHCVFSRLP